MSKIGIMSMQRVINYGSFLQAYALKTTLEKMGHNVEFVDYHVNIINESRKKRNIILKKIKSFNNIKIPFTQKIKFYLFHRNFSKKYHHLIGIDKYNYLPQLDALVIGSDEVFNCFQKGNIVGYSLELFGKDNKAELLCSYAASFGNTTLKKIELNNKKEELKYLLKKFDFISVRDDNSFSIIENLVGLKPSKNIDPVLLYNFNDDTRFDFSRKIKEKYIIVYAYTNRINKVECDKIEKFAKQYNLKIITIGAPQNLKSKFVSISPFDVLGYFKNAEYIITDTFHGTIFSMINHCNFVTIVRKSVNGSYGNEEKLTSLLEGFNLRSRIINDLDDIGNVINTEINYDLFEKILEDERKKSIDFLSKIK